ncbi:glycine zipper 2TM domain-containing protein [Niveibacterium sp. 24ML]|uniref:glycine zipper 2TM domain-containing protein n=1 Tax=Niveibacterium sp. 24ML TaxID=2985512 RepID=UPI002270376A|nr:glycine zipper 2TM domain-containing protein [Niveibacterium sp. 24ML]MCX9155243.1 glycine zipper 2TM domain-containing protein [Niveibacterium sp. 24ML]
MTNAHAVKPPSMHPMMWVAAGSVSLFSLTGIAALTGMIPARLLEPTPDPLANAASAAVTPPPLAAPIASAGEATVTVPQAAVPASAATPPANTKPAPKPASKPAPTHKPEAHREKTAPVRATEAEAAPRAIPTRTPDDKPRAVTVAQCYDCGVVENVQAVEQAGEGSGLGAVGGAVLGGVLGHQVGEGQGKQLARIGGAILGGIAGHQAEKQIRKTSHYEVTVRMDDGSRKTLTQTTATTWHTGERVRVENGVIVGRAETASSAML